MLTTSQLLALTRNHAPEVVRRARNPKSLALKQDTMFSPDGGKKKRFIYYRTGLNNDESSGLYHSCVIRVDGAVSDPKQFLLRSDSKLWVHCRCPYFTYYLEMALFLQKASDIWDCDGTVGKRIRNPNMTPYLCKHLYASILTTLEIEKNESIYKPSARNKKFNYGKFPPEATRRG